MLVKHLFCSLLERLDELEEKWVTAVSNEERQALQKELRQLRQTSDEILDSWLHFEERISQFDKVMATNESNQIEEGPFKEIPDDAAEKILQEIKKMANSGEKSTSTVSILSADVARIFRKGQGYYNLLMYPQAAEHFKEVIEQEPDLDIARMFLAFSELMNGSMEEADRHFHLLSKTTDQNPLKATAFNAQGCIVATRKEWEKALNCFEQAIDLYPQLKDPYFNRALVLMELKRYEEACAIWLKLAEQDPDDWEAQLQLAACYVAEGDEERAYETLTRLRQSAKGTDVLIETAKKFEELREFGNAALCFQLALNEKPTLALAWHGLGWNLWHADGSSLGIDYIRKAIALSPNNPDFQFSYGWILCHQRSYDEAERVFRALLKQEGKYPLALAGLAQVLTSMRQWEEAEARCRQLIEESHASIQSLGYFQAGRLAMAQSQYERARRFFNESVRLNPHLKDNQLWLGLAHYLSGNRSLAQEVWERQM